MDVPTSGLLFSLLLYTLFLLFCSSGAVYQEGSIDPGDLIIQANDIPFTNMSNDDAVKVLRDLAKKPGLVDCLSSV